MRVPFELFISLRYLRAKRRYGFFNTFVSIGGVALGVMTLIVVIAVMSGFEREMKEKVIGVYSELSIGNRDLIYEYDRAMEKALTVPGVQAVTPSVLGQVLVRGEKRARGVVLKGIDPEGEARVTALDEYIVAGTLRASGPGVIVGEELAGEMGFRLGETVTIISPIEVTTPNGPVPLVAEREITGIFDSGMYEYDSSLVYADLETVQKLFRFGNAVQELNVKITDIDEGEQIRAELSRAFPLPFIVSSWMERNPSLFAAVRMEKKVMFFILALIVLVAALNIASTLIMVVMEKTKDIGILKAIGVRTHAIMRIFTVEGFLIGVSGALLGTAVGVVFAARINVIADFIGVLTGFKLFRSDVYYLDRIPVELSGVAIIYTAIIAVLLSTVAALYPAWKAARVNPVEVLRYE